MITDVAVDIDGVMFDFATVIHEKTSKYMGVPLSYPTQWEFYKEWGMTSENFHAYLRRLAVEDDIFNQGSPYHNTKEGWSSLREQGLKIHIITHRPWEGYEQTVRWLERFQLIPDTLHFTGDKAGVLQGIAEGEYASIDDHYEQYASYYYRGAYSFLHTQPWNDGYPARRADDLLDFAEAIKFYNDKWAIKGEHRATKLPF